MPHQASGTHMQDRHGCRQNTTHEFLEVRKGRRMMRQIDKTRQDRQTHTHTEVGGGRKRVWGNIIQPPIACLVGCYSLQVY